MEVLPGRRKSSRLYKYNNYLYKRNRERGNASYFKCSTQLCPARAKSVGEVVTLNHNHNHRPPQDDEGEFLLFMEELRRESMVDGTPLSLIFSRIKRRYPDLLVSYISVKRAMQTARKSVRPPNIGNIAELNAILSGPRGQLNEEGLPWFPHPERQRGRFDKWLDVVGIEECPKLSRLRIYNSLRLCKAHFSPDQFLYQKVLKKTSVPNINLPDVSRKTGVVRPLDLPSPVSSVGSSTLLTRDQVLQDFREFSFGDPVADDQIVDPDEDLVRKKVDEDIFDLEVLEEKLFVDGDGIWEVNTEEYIIPSKRRRDGTNENSSVRPCLIFITPDCIDQFKSLPTLEESVEQFDNLPPVQDSVEHLDNLPDDSTRLYSVDSHFDSEAPPSPHVEFDFQFRQDCHRRYGKKSKGADDRSGTVSATPPVNPSLDGSLCTVSTWTGDFVENSNVSPVQFVDINLLSTPEIVVDVSSGECEESAIPSNLHEGVVRAVPSALPSELFSHRHSLSVAPSENLPVPNRNPQSTSKKKKRKRKNTEVIIPQAIRCDFCGSFVESSAFLEHSSAHYSRLSGSAARRVSIRPSFVCYSRLN